MKTRLITAVALATLIAAPVFAQTAAPTAPTAPTAPRAATTATPPAAPAAPVVAAPTAKTTAPVAQTQKVNLNTATLAELDKLPQVGEARAKQIVELRTKGKFKGWADFESRATGTSLNKTALDAIKDKVTF